MEPKILYEDPFLMVLDKPSGWVVNDAATTGEVETLQAWIRNNFDFETAKKSDFRSGIVHRLDKETSGIIIVAKTEKAFLDLQRQFKARVVKKSYIALVHGVVEPREGEINVNVGRLPWNRERFGVLPGGREAATKYRVISNFASRQKSSEKFSLIEFNPETGRTHQIRIHAKYLSHPIVSDSFYAGRKTARRDRVWCPRLFLHAQKIKFEHPKRGEPLSVSAGLPHDLKLALAKLQEI